MDIEGSEFSAMENILAEKCCFGQLCIEVHDRFLKNGRKLLKEMIRNLNNNGYYLSFISTDGEVMNFVRFEKDKAGLINI